MFLPSRPPLNLYVTGGEGRRAQYTRTLSPTCLLFPADLKVRGSPSPIAFPPLFFLLCNGKSQFFNRIEVYIPSLWIFPHFFTPSFSDPYQFVSLSSPDSPFGLSSLHVLLPPLHSSLLKNPDLVSRFT